MLQRVRLALRYPQLVVDAIRGLGVEQRYLHWMRMIYERYLCNTTKIWDKAGLYTVDYNTLVGVVENRLLHRVNPKLGLYLFHYALYFVCRALKPAIAVETGVNLGVSSAFILHALADNGKGELYSVDLPEQPLVLEDGRIIRNTLPRSASTGYLVPQRLRHRYHLILGDAREKLPPLLQDLQQIDLFVHDSDHTYAHMTWEYATAWQYLRSGGVLISDDVDLNRAFDSFCKDKELIHWALPKSAEGGYFGLTVKP